MSAAIGKLLVGRGRECPHTRKGRVEKKKRDNSKNKTTKKWFYKRKWWCNIDVLLLGRDGCS